MVSMVTKHVLRFTTTNQVYSLQLNPISGIPGDEKLTDLENLGAGLFLRFEDGSTPDLSPPETSNSCRE